MQSPFKGKRFSSEEIAKEAAWATARHVAAETAETPFRSGDAVVYASHGVGRVVEIGPEQIAGHSIEIIRISFPKERMVLRVPSSRAHSSGLRHVATPERLSKAIDLIRDRPHVSKLPWVKRSQVLQADVASGDLFRLARVLRDLRPQALTGVASFSAQSFFDTALERFAAEAAMHMEGDEAAVAESLMSIMTGANDAEASAGFEVA